MPKSKKPADAFGLSLLDVLSNALGGVILLMLIVASAIASGERKKQSENPISSGGGKVLSDTDFEKVNEDEDTIKVFTTQLKIIGIPQSSVHAELISDLVDLAAITDKTMGKSDAYFLISGQAEELENLVVSIWLTLDDCDSPKAIQAFSTMGNTPKKTDDYSTIKLDCGVNKIELDYSGSDKVIIEKK